MKLGKVIFMIGLLLMMTTSGGCSYSTIDGVMPSLEVSTSIISIDRTPTSFQEQSVTPSLLPEQTSTPTVTPSPTYTPTSIPTLPADDANRKLLDLLTNNGGCRLPCLWGITPGESTFEQVLIKLWPLRNISVFTSHDNKVASISPVYTKGELNILTSISLSTYADNEIVKRIIYQAGSFHKFQSESFASGYSYSEVFDISAFGKIAAVYMLPGILSIYGRPDSVLILTYGGPTGNFKYNYFEIVLLYPDQGMLVHYTTQKRMVGNNILGCMANAHVEINLVRSGKGTAFKDLISPAWNDRLAYYKPVEELTSMSVDDFYQAFRQPTEKCITIPNKLLPTMLP
jgi:hypothetical protein